MKNELCNYKRSKFFEAPQSFLLKQVKEQVRVIRNTKYKRENLKGIFRHNERRNKNYSNENIDKEKTYLNYS